MNQIEQGGVASGLVAEMADRYSHQLTQNLETLEQLLSEYFETGYGVDLPEKQRPFVSNRARRLTISWSEKGMLQWDDLGEDDRAVLKDEVARAKRDSGLVSFDSLKEELESLGLTRPRQVGLERRAWNLAHNALKKADPVS